jgi:hypothetical protein
MRMISARFIVEPLPRLFFIHLGAEDEKVTRTAKSAPGNDADAPSACVALQDAMEGNAAA